MNAIAAAFIAACRDELEAPKPGNVHVFADGHRMTAADFVRSAEEAAGLFGPGSVSWRVDREVIVLAGGSCALLMQAAHPMVAAGVAEHSTYASDPFGRLLRTGWCSSTTRAGWFRSTNRDLTSLRFGRTK